MTIKPKETDALFANPHMGWQTFHRFADEDKSLAGLPSSSVYFRFYWREIEPREGILDYAKLDGLFAHARKCGQQLCFRVMTTGSGEYLDVPQWLKDKGCKGVEYVYRDGGGKKHWSPDLDDPIFQEAHFRMIRELGKRYNGHPDLDLMDIGTVGLWGEWHMSGTGVEMPTMKTRLAIIDEWKKAFSKHAVVMQLDDTDPMKYAAKLGCGWRVDCLGDLGGFSKTWNHMRDQYPKAIREAAVENLWQRAPVAFESCWDMQKWAKEAWDIRYIYDYALNLHGSYMNNKSAPIPEGTRADVERFLRKLGYRLVLRELSHPATVKRGEKLSVTTTWENVGVAPPYHDYLLAFRLGGEILATKTSIKGWLPEKKEITETISPQKNLAAGKQKLSLALVDPATKQPTVRLAIEGRADDGWYPLSEVEVK